MNGKAFDYLNIVMYFLTFSLFFSMIAKISLFLEGGTAGSFQDLLIPL